LLVDTHCHLYLPHFNLDIVDVYNNARGKDVLNFIVPGIDLETSIKAINLSETYEGIFAAVGVHPNRASYWEDDHFSLLLELANHPKVVAIGEIGLDYYRTSASREDQQKILIKQLELAHAVAKPIILHCREAFEDLWRILLDSVFEKNWNLVKSKGVFHSFSESMINAQKIVERNYKIGISGPVTYKSGISIQHVVSSTPLEHILVETDCPYLSPHPYRGKRNEPAYITEIVKMIASQKNLLFDQIANQTTRNSYELFGLGESH
jgi:TatD DNase family protein